MTQEDTSIHNYNNMWDNYPQYRLDIEDSTHRNFAVIVHTEPGKIGHYYKFKPFKAKLVKEGYDEADVNYGGKLKNPIPIGTEVIIDTWWMNFYGSYYKIKYNERNYDVKTTSIEIDIDSFIGKKMTQEEKELSHKERYAWKPSDEQLDALHDAAVYIEKSMFPYPKGILMKLYEQLKKLREE